MNLFACQLAPLRWSHPGEREAAESGAGEFLDGHSKELEHIAQFAISRLDERHSDDRVAAVVFDELKLRHRTAGHRPFDARFSSISLAHAADLDSHGVECGLIDLPLDECLVDLGDVEPRVRERVCEFAVVGHDDEACGLEIEAANGKEPRFGRMVDDLHDRRAIKIGLVGVGDEHPLGLVDHQVQLAFNRGQGPPVDDDSIMARIDEDGKAP